MKVLKWESGPGAAQQSANCLQQINNSKDTTIELF